MASRSHGYGNILKDLPLVADSCKQSDSSNNFGFDFLGFSFVLLSVLVGFGVLGSFGGALRVVGFWGSRNGFGFGGLLFAFSSVGAKQEERK